jgi:serine/threonine-protein kinase
MSLSPGTRVGPYEITAQIGAGGMGEVCRARDTKLNREVALKVLPAAFGTDPDRMARFQREAQLLAALNHPNIAAIYGLEDEGGVHAIVMELVEGHTLTGPVPVPDALPIAKQIAEALEYAHDRGIIHRDLKPANIKVTPEGMVKVLDFGLAKAMDEATDLALSLQGSMSPTLSLAATHAGVIMGTAGYMAPEQAKGKGADRRSDIWSFGIVLYELLTGSRMFEGDTVPETLASVMKDQVTLEKLPAETPSAIRKLLARCLEREPRRRLQSIGEARIVIEDVLTDKATALVSIHDRAMGMVAGGDRSAGRGWSSHVRVDATCTRTARHDALHHRSGRWHAAHDARTERAPSGCVPRWPVCCVCR